MSDINTTITGNSLSERAMLVTLNISMWTGKSYDKEVTIRAAQEYNADPLASGRFQKMLVGKEALKTIALIESRTRAFHYRNTLPWRDGGERLLPSANFMEYSSRMREFRVEYEAAVEEFLIAYPTYFFEAKLRLSEMFRQADYPTVDQLRAKFGLMTEIYPVPSSADFRVSIREDEKARIQSEIEGRLLSSQQRAMKELWQRLFDVVSHISDKLSDPKAVFRDSLIGNARELVDLLPRLNIMDDPQLEDLRRQVDQKLCSHDPENLRRSSMERFVAAQEAKSILDAMSAYIGVSSEPLVFMEEEAA